MWAPGAAWLVPLLLQAQAVMEPPRRAPVAGTPSGAMAGAAAGAVVGAAWRPREDPAGAETSGSGLRDAPGPEGPAEAGAQAERPAPGAEPTSPLGHAGKPLRRGQNGEEGSPSPEGAAGPGQPGGKEGGAGTAPPPRGHPQPAVGPPGGAGEEVTPTALGADGGDEE